MKKVIISIMAGAMLVFCGNFAQGREEPKDSVDKQAQYRSRAKQKIRRLASEKDKSGAVRRTRTTEIERGSRRGRDMMIGRRLEVIQKQMEQKEKAHNAFVGQLKAIKNQAEKEGAQKTVAMLANLIAREEKKTAESVKKLEKDKEKIAGRIETYKRPGEVQAVSEKKAEAEEPKPAEATEVEKKKKKKWWKFGKD